MGSLLFVIDAASYDAMPHFAFTPIQHIPLQEIVGAISRKLNVDKLIRGI